MPVKESVKERLSRVRPPRVHLTYDVEVGGAIEAKELPFVLGVLGDFSALPEGTRPPLRDRKFVEIHRDNFDEVLAGMAPRLSLRVPGTLDEPEPRAEPADKELAALGHGILRRILDAWPLRDTAEQDSVEMALAELLLRHPHGLKGLNLERVINGRIAAIDEEVSAQLDEVLHHGEFQRLEASWRGLRYLVMNAETGTNLKIRVLNVTRHELLEDLEAAPGLEESALFQKVYSEGFDTLGGQPFGALIGDYEFTSHQQDVRLLEKIAAVAAAAHAPFVAAASPRMFGRDSFTEFAGVGDLARIMGSPEYAAWHSFRESENSRYVGLCLPHILLRLPYGEETPPSELFNYKEDVGVRGHGKYLWGNAAYAFGTRLTDAFAKYHWLATIRGVEGGGLVEGLPVHTFDDGEGNLVMKCPTEIAITDRREKELSDLGFIPLVHCQNTDYAAFFTAPSCQAPRRYDTDIANANSRIVTQLRYVFAASRFAHYLMAMMRDKIGSFMERGEAEHYLNRWIGQYITTDPAAGSQVKAERPLAEARVDVVDVEGKPGHYRAVLFLRPHFQLDELTVSLRVVIDLPVSAR